MNKLIFSFKSLYKNNVILDDREPQKWWLAVIFFILSMTILMIGPLVSGLSTNGSAIFSGQTELTNGFSAFSEKKPDLSIDENGILVYGENVTPTAYLEDNTQAYERYDSTVTVEPMKVNDELMRFEYDYYPNESDRIQKVTRLQVFYFDKLDPINSKEDRVIYNNIINNYIYRKDTTDNSFVSIPVSTMILTKTNVRVYSYRIDATITSTQSALLEGNFKNLKGFSLTSELANTNAYDSINVWKDFFNKSYDPIKVTSAWTSVGIFVGISALVILVAGVILFVFTRSKKNLYHSLSIWATMKIAIFLSLTPAIITMILWFVMPSFGYMAFILVYAFRAMFLAMKVTGSGANKSNNNAPVYQARS